MSDFVTEAGLEIPTLEEILNDITTEQKDTIDPALNTEPDDPMGQVDAIVANAIRELFEGVQIAHDAFDPDAAEDTELENVSAITGTVRLGATKSLAKFVDLDLDAAITVPAGSVIHVVDRTADRFVLLEDVTSVGPGVFTGNFEAETAGPLVANSGTLTVIATPVTGWNSVTNPTDVIVGKNVETDEELRIRRETELRAQGSGTVDAIRADLLKLIAELSTPPPVFSVKVFENDGDVIDPGTGLPPHSFEALIFDGDSPAAADDDLAQNIWDNKPAGIQAVGTSSGTATDSEGDDQIVAFSRPTGKDVFFEFDIKTDATYVGDDVLKTAVVDRSKLEQFPGDDVIINVYDSVAQFLEGVTDVIAVRVGFAAFPSGTVNLVIGLRELARMDTARIVVAIV